MTFENVFKDEESRIHFSKYAITSKDKEHPIQEDYRIRALNDIKNGKLEEKFEEKFTTGILGCLAISREEGKDKIDKDVVNKWFIGKHNKISTCKAYEGRVIGLKSIVYLGDANRESEEMAVVKTSEGQGNYKTILEPKLEIGKIVKVHGDYVISD
jgi:hypothetical protein